MLCFLLTYVVPGPATLPFTIKEYVGIGCADKEQNEEGIWDALALTGADKFVADLPEGDNTYVDAGSGVALDSRWKLPRISPLKKEVVPILEGDDGEILEKDPSCLWSREIVKQESNGESKSIWYPLQKPKSRSLSGGQVSRVPFFPKRS